MADTLAIDIIDSDFCLVFCKEICCPTQIILDWLFFKILVWTMAGGPLLFLALQSYLYLLYPLVGMQGVILLVYMNNFQDLQF